MKDNLNIMEYHRRIARERISEMEAEGRGPIRRRIDSLTIKLEPFEKILTDEEAVSVRNVIESLLQDYFFEVQPWVIRTETENSFSDSSDLAVEGIGDEEIDASSLRANKSGSVTYVGLAQIVENKQTEDQTGVKVTMNGLVYFAEGSENIPNEDELLQTMEEQALGDSQVVVDALRDFFPTQQTLVVTVETPTTTLATIAPVKSPPVGAEKPDGEIFPITTTEVPVAIDLLETEVSVTDREDGLFQSDPKVVLGTTTEMQSLGLEDSSRERMILGGGTAVGILFLGMVVGLLTVQRRRKRAVAYRTNQIRNASGGNEYLVDNGELGLSLSQEDWKANSNNVTHKDDNAEVAKIHTAAKVLPLSLPTEIPTEDSEMESSPTNSTVSYFSSLFQRKSPIAEKHLEISSTKSSDDEQKLPKHNKVIQEANMSTYQFTDDGSSDFSDVVSIQPHVVSLKSLESFEEQHTSMTRQEYVVQKDQLGSSFEEPPINILSDFGRGAEAKTSAPPKTAGTVESLKAISAPTSMPSGQAETSRDTLNYSSSSMSSREPQHQQLQQSDSGAASILVDLEREEEKEAEKEDQRIRYTMMPNPYVRHRQGKGDRSAPCVLKATEFTAASLSRASGINNGNNTSILSSSSSSSGEAASPANSARGMIPKLAAPSWWSSQDDDNGNSNKSGNRHRRSRSGRSSPAVKEAFREEYLAYSADEENTFGVPESDGWDPTDTALSSMGDSPSQDDIKMVEFQVGKITPPQSPPGEKFPSTSRMPSPSSRKNIEVAKAVLQRIKSSPESQSSGHKLGESITKVTSDYLSEEIRFDSSKSS